MRTFSRTSQFKKDVKLADKRGKDLHKLKKLLDLLIEGVAQPSEYKDHPLRGEFAGSRDAHVEPDWILIYTLTEGDRTSDLSALELTATSSVEMAQFLTGMRG